LGTRTFNIAPWIEEDRDQNNGLWGMHTGQGLYYGHVHGACYIPTTGEAQYDPVWAHPGFGVPYEGIVRGHPNAGTMHGGWRILALYDGERSYICYGMPSESAYGLATHVWHGAEAVVPERVTHMKVHNPDPHAQGQPELLFATASWDVPPVVKLYRQSLPKTGTPILEMLMGTNFQPADASSLLLPADDWGRPSAVQTLLELELLTERVSQNDYLQAYAAADAGAFIYQGIAQGDAAYTSMSSLDPLTGRYITPRVDMTGHAILRSIELRAAMNYELREARLYRLILAEDNALKTPRGRENRDPMARMLDLKTMVGRIVTLEDDYPMRVRVLQVMTPERRQLGGPNRAGAWSLVVPLLVSILDQPYRFDGADRYDITRTWG
jgi:hypothetical protein